MHLAGKSITMQHETSTKSILLPTDLSISSLYPIHEICKNAGGQRCNIYVVHTLNAPTGIMDLLFLKDRKPYKMLSSSFLEGLEMLRKKYASTIHLLSFEFLYGHSRAYLRGYMDARGIGSIYMLRNYQYLPGLEQSVNCIAALQKCKKPITYVEKSFHAEVGTLTTLLYKEKMLA
jgi:hypothetical protein